MPIEVINGVRLNWELSGDSGEPFVLVHGSWGDHHSWDRIVPALARSYRVLTYDRRGHSLSERPVSQGSVLEDAEDLSALIQHLKLAPAHILGNSFGGSIALRLAAQRPELFRSVMVHEPPLFGVVNDPAALAPIEISRQRVRLVVDLLERGEMEAGARLFMETIAMGPGAWEQLPVALRQTFIFNAPTFLDEYHDPERYSLDRQALGNFRQAALLSQGEQGAPTFPPVLDEIARALPHAQRKILPQVGHVPQMSHPDEYVEVLTSFIRST